MPAMHQGGWAGAPPQPWISGAHGSRGHHGGVGGRGNANQGYPPGWGGGWQAPAGGYAQPSVRYA